MLSLIKKLFAKKAEVSATPWPFPTSKVSVKPADEPVTEAKVQVVAAVPAAKKPARTKSAAVTAKSAPRKPRAPRAQ
jgi:hypothetical protein